MQLEWVATSTKHLNSPWSQWGHGSHGLAVFSHLLLTGRLSLPHNAYTLISAEGVTHWIKRVLIDKVVEGKSAPTNCLSNALINQSEPGRWRAALSAARLPALLRPLTSQHATCPPLSGAAVRGLQEHRPSVRPLHTCLLPDRIWPPPATGTAPETNLAAT